MNRTSKNTGFTLIELLVVVTILAILAVFASSRWPGTNINLNAEAQKLASEIRRAQSLAMSHGQRYRVNLSSSNYSITDSSGTVYYTDVVKGQNTISFATGDTVSWSSTILPNSIISFDENGEPYVDAAATTALTTTAIITLANGGMSRTVSITPGTGRVIVQ